MQLTESCRAVDPQSTDQAIAHATDADPVAGEKASTTKLAVEALLPEVVKETPPEQAFGAGVFED
jgi:hypothetical protein